MTQLINPTLHNSGVTKIGQIQSFSEKYLTFILKLYGNNISFLERLPALLIYHSGQLVPFFIRKLEKAGENMLRVSFEEVQNSRQAEELIHSEVFTDFPLIEKKVTGRKTYELLKVNPGLLIGFTLINQQDESVGQISNYYNTPGQLLLSLEVNTKEYLMPFLKHLFKGVDERKKTIRMEIPEGLLDG